jgi:hypothetical protein
MSLTAESLSEPVRVRVEAAAKAYGMPLEGLYGLLGACLEDIARNTPERLNPAPRVVEAIRRRMGEQAIERAECLSVGFDAGEYEGKNPVLELFRLYGVELPLRTQGWVNTTLAAITTEGYSRYAKIGGKKRGESERFGECLWRLKQAVKLTPIEQLRGIVGDKPAIPRQT